MLTDGTRNIISAMKRLSNAKVVVVVVVVIVVVVVGGGEWW